MPNILVVEDEPAILANVARVLRLEGYTVITAKNGSAGLACARAHAPDLILCDIRMPEMNGDELLTTLRADAATRDIPFVFATASAETTSREERLRQGAHAYLIKPYDFKQLLTTLRTLLPPP